MGGSYRARGPKRLRLRRVQPGAPKRPFQPYPGATGGGVAGPVGAHRNRDANAQLPAVTTLGGCGQFPANRDLLALWGLW